MSAEIRTFSCERFTMSYAVFGRGPRALVILPGMSLQSVLLSAGAVARAFSMFESTHTVYLFDRKDDMQAGYTVMDMAEDTAEAMLGLGLRDCDIYGTSQGGMMALAIAIGHPELTHRLAVASTLARQNARSKQTMAEWRELCLQGDPVALNRSIFSKVYSPAFYAKNERAFRILEKNGTAEDIRRFAILSDATTGFDIYGHLTEIRCPAVVFGVRDDTVLSGEGAREIAEKLHCPYFIFEGKGHAAYDEDPFFPSRLHDFLCD